jgi:hypothetical protein
VSGGEVPSKLNVVGSNPIARSTVESPIGLFERRGFLFAAMSCRRVQNSTRSPPLRR